MTQKGTHHITDRRSDDDFSRCYLSLSTTLSAATATRKAILINIVGTRADDLSISKNVMIQLSNVPSFSCEPNCGEASGWR